MNICESHILKGLDTIKSDSRTSFDTIYETLINPSKNRFKDFLYYVNTLIDNVINQDNSDLNYAHIHFPQFEHETTILLEFLLIKFYLKNALEEGIASNDSYFHNHLEKIKVELDQPIHLDLGASRRDEKKKRERKKKLKELKKSVLELQAKGIDSNTLEHGPNCLFNVLSKDKNDILNSLDVSPYFMTPEDIRQCDLLHPLSFVLMNSDLTRDDLDDFQFENGKYLLDNIENVVLFNCEGKTTNRQFNYFDLKEFNNEGTKFRNLTVLSFDQKPFRFNRLLSQLSVISTRYHQRPSGLNFQTYVTLPVEINALLNEPEPLKAQPSFWGSESFLWQGFQQYVYEHGALNELISIKMRNMYALCFNSAYKAALLNQLFSSPSEKSSLVSAETSEALTLLENESLKELKKLLNDVLDLVQKLGHSDIVSKQRDKGKYDIIIPYKILQVKSLFAPIQRLFTHLGKVNFTTWRDIDFNTKRHVIILDYRDSGRFPYQIYPSLMEHSFPAAKSIDAPVYTAFFKYNYDHASFEYSYSLYQKALDHPIRQQYFNWSQLEGKIQSLKPENSSSAYLWDLDNTYSNFGSRDTISINLSSIGKRIYSRSQLFIAVFSSDEQMFSVRAEDIPNHIAEHPLSIQPLDELYEGLNLFTTTPEEEMEIHQLKMSYNLTEAELEHRLWKTLLLRGADELGTSETYSELKQFLEKQRLTLVSENHFMNNWINLESDMLIPRSKRMFKAVCDYLELPTVYFRVLLKKRANERLASRQSNSKMNRLIAELIDRGMFHQSNPELEFDKSFLLIHDLDEIGFTEANLTKELYALCDLLKPNLNLNRVERAEMKKS